MRTIVFIDGQNLFHLARGAWGAENDESARWYGWPSYDVIKLARALVDREPGRHLAQTRFYTGVPSPQRSERWHRFWNAKLFRLRSQGVDVYRGRVSRHGQEKGVDVSVAIDLVHATHQGSYDLAIIVSQDSDFGPAVRLAKQIAKSRGRIVQIESAFPLNPMQRIQRGIPGTRWHPIERSTYDACLEPERYRPK